MLDIVLSILFILSGFFFIFSRKKILRKGDIRNLRKLWMYHLLFSIIFYLYTRSYSADANGYWRISKESSWDDILYFLSKGMGTPMMYAVNYFPSAFLDLSIFTGILIYSLIGFFGFYFFYRIIIDIIPNNTRLFGYFVFPFLLFLPSLHFWSSGTGKDTLLFFSIAMFAFSLLQLRKRIILFLVGSLITFLIRPHVFIILIAAWGCAFLLSNKISGYRRVLAFMVFTALIIFILPMVMDYTSIDGNTLEDAFIRLNEQASNLSGDNINSSIDIQSYPFYGKVLTFLYRPLFFDYYGIFSLVASIENLILVVLSIKVLQNKPIETFRKAPLVIKMLLLFLIFGTLIFSLSLSNLGIILRMKNMFILGLLVYCIWSFSYNYGNQERSDVKLKN